MAEKQIDWLDGIELACDDVGGVPQEILFDNAKSIMIERDAYGVKTASLASKVARSSLTIWL